MAKTILVSAGHTNVAGSDRGMAGNGFIEGVEATKLRDDVAATLRSAGHTVIEDGSDGINDPLKRAIALAKTAQTAVEFHFNAGPPTATGIEVLAKTKNKQLAQRIAGAIASATGIKLRGDAGWKSDSSGQHHRLGFCEAGGLIVEVCFMSSRNDMAAYVANYASIVANIAAAIGGKASTPKTAPAKVVETPAQAIAEAPAEQTQPAVTNTVVEQTIVESTPGVETTTTKTAESIAAPVEVQKESPSWMVKIAAPFTALMGLGINAGSLIQTKLEQMTVQQIGYMVAALGLVALGIYWWQRSAKAAQVRTMQLVEKAADPNSTTVILKK